MIENFTLLLTVILGFETCEEAYENSVTLKILPGTCVS